MDNLLMRVNWDSLARDSIYANIDDQDKGVCKPQN